MMPSERSLTRSLIWRFRAAILLLSHLVKVLAGVLLARDYCSRTSRIDCVPCTFTHASSNKTAMVACTVLCACAQIGACFKNARSFTVKGPDTFGKRQQIHKVPDPDNRF